MTTTPRTEEIRASVRTLIRDVVAPAAMEVDAAGRFPAESIDALGRAGLLALMVPPQLGGLGEGLGTFAAVAEDLAGACASTAMIWVMHTAAVSVLAGSEVLDRRDERIAAITAGRELCGIAATEPGSRSFFWLPSSQLVDQGDAGHLEVTATKRFVTAAAHARHFVAISRRPGAAAAIETTLYLVAAGSPGVRVDPRFDGLGLRGNESGQLHLQGLRVEQGDLLCKHGDGLPFASSTLLPMFCVGTAALANGLARLAVGTAAHHLQETSLAGDGTRLRDLAPLRARLAEMSVRTEASRALLANAVAELERQTATAPLTVLQARHAAINAAWEVTDLAVKTCGGAAFSRPSPVERAYRDARIGWVMSPTSDALADMIGRALTGMALV